jgi:PqqD family protein of HPr-rel-A system
VLFFERVRGVHVEAVGDGWVSYSPISGLTHLLNNECAAILEVLAAGDGMALQAVCESLAADTCCSTKEIEQVLEVAWQTLIDAGLIRRMVGGTSGLA